MTALAADLSTISVLWRRELKKFWRQPSRLVGALGQPIIFWGVIGSGMAATFHLPGAQVGYLEYFYPGVVLMVALFASIFASVSVIEDRHLGFLQAVLAGPGSRPALVVGKCLGATSVAMLQIGAFLLLAPWAGFAWGTVHWPLLISTLVAACMGLCALGFAAAWILDNVQAYHAVQMTLLVPLWVISGAMFPPTDAAAHGTGAFAWAMQHNLRVNPVAYAVSAVRHALYGGHAPASTTMDVSAWAALTVVVGFAAVATWLAAGVCQRRR